MYVFGLVPCLRCVSVVCVVLCAVFWLCDAVVEFLCVVRDYVCVFVCWQR